uniref:Retroviral polymerase SH3-like domain-containing protein n=1 Tax=Nicotiana tabacum TaxID=4097 RepID=A0A1S3Z0H3_TOBAC|nr:PREDICTED: putative protein TPRXL [Nicotiana tabacum]
MPCVFIGYPFGKKGYKLYSLHTKSVLVSKDVIFHECVFPFHLSSSPYSLSSPISTAPPLFHSLSDPVAPNCSTPSSAGSPSTSSFPSTSTSQSSHTPPSVSFPSPFPSSPALVASPHPPLRKSTRPHNLPSYLQDFVVKLPSSFCSSTTSTSIVSTVAVEPHSYIQAAASPAWQEAMRKEF